MPKTIGLTLRSAALVHSSEQDRRDLRSLTPRERLEGLEALRQAYFGYGDDSPSLERVLECVSLGEHKISSDWSIGRAALLKNKRAAGRRKDLIDVAMLEDEGDESRL